MADKKISPDRWQALYGPVSQEFELTVQQTLKKTREASVMKRLTLRTVLVMLICLLLLTGIALAATGVFSTKNSLDMYTSAPSDGEGVDMQTDLHQTGGDFPDLTVTVRDAVFDGVTAYVTVEYRLKNPEKDMILYHWDTYGWKFANIQRWPGYSQHPLSDPETDPRRKLVIYGNGALVYGLYNHSISDPIYESDGVLVLTWRIRMDDDKIFDVGYSWESNTGIYDESKAAYYQETIENVFRKVASNEPLELTLIEECQEWDGDIKTPGKQLYFCNVEITLNKGPAPVIRRNQTPITQGELTLTNANITFTKLATYMDIRIKYPLVLGDDPAANKFTYGLEFEWIDKDGNVIPILGHSMSGAYNWEAIGDIDYEMNQFSAFWPAAEQIPDTITIRAYNVSSKERLGTFTIPLTTMSSPSPILSTDEPLGTLPVIQTLVPSPSPAP